MNINIIHVNYFLNIYCKYFLKYILYVCVFIRVVTVWDFSRYDIVSENITVYGIKQSKQGFFWLTKHVYSNFINQNFIIDYILV